MNLGNFELARELLDQATELAPNESELLAMRSYELALLGEFDAAIEAAEHGLRMNPYSPDFYLDGKAMAYFLMDRDQDALRFWAQVSEPIPDCMAWEVAAFTYLGDEEAAQRKSEEFLREYAAIWAGDPSAGPKDYVRWITQVSNPFMRDEDRERLVEGLRRAGL
jgi:tetratricopeptide (TPR) repeat protein